MTYPLVFALLLVLFVLLIIWLLPKLWRALREVFARLRGATAVTTPAAPAIPPPRAMQ